MVAMNARGERQPREEMSKQIRTRRQLQQPRETNQTSITFYLANVAGFIKAESDQHTREVVSPHLSEFDT